MLNILLLSACVISNGDDSATKPYINTSDESIIPIQGVPETSASAITHPPSDMQNINNQTDLYGTGADPEMITLGPKEGGRRGWPPYKGKTSMEFELSHAQPVLAPIGMSLIGFDNRSAKFGITSNGSRQSPFNDLEICFQSESQEWPSMVICVYHLLSSPLLFGHNIDTSCGEIDEWVGTYQAKGHLFFEYDDYIVDTANANPCRGLIGYKLKRGQIIGFAGSVGEHSMAPFRIKVHDVSVNPLVQKGDKNLHWVQPGSFFYWKCIGPEISFPKGVLAYPFECGGYQLSVEQRNSDYKYEEL